MTSESCARCHKDIYEQWNSSAHHFSSFNNQWYRKSIEYMQDVVGTKPSKWCAGCHDHAVFFNGRFDRPIKEQIDTPEAQAGLGCMSCHAITHVKSTMGQGDFEIEYPPLHDLAVSEQPVLRWAHDKLLDLDPQPHREAFLKPFHTDQTPEFCSSCHKVHLDVPGERLPLDSAASTTTTTGRHPACRARARARSTTRPTPQKCADCHMPLGRVERPRREERHGASRTGFPAANTALPFVNGDKAQLEAVQEFLQHGQVSVDVFGIVRGGEPGRRGRGPSAHAPSRRSSSTFAVGEESMGFGAAGASLACSGEVVGAARQGAGRRAAGRVGARGGRRAHAQGRATSSRAARWTRFDVWVELEAVDDRGRVLLHSGAVAATEDGTRGAGGALLPQPHARRRGQPASTSATRGRRGRWPTCASFRRAPPTRCTTGSTSRTRRVSAISLQGARLNYRKFAWWNTQWAYAGVRDPRARRISR